MNYQLGLIDRLNKKESKICIVGLGYVGLPLAIRYSKIGYHVIGLDVDESKVNQINDGRSPIEHITTADVTSARANGFAATTDMSIIQNVDAIILCLPTPLNKYREPDLQYIIDTMNNILPYLRAGQIVSLESTTYPGTTFEEIAPRIESRSFIIGENFFLVYSPEREDPGNKHFSTQSIPKICGGHTKECLAVGMVLYGLVIDRVVPVSSTQTAELTKLLENIHRAVNIGLINEMKIVADRMSIDIYEVIEAASTKPFGFVPYYPGPGLGGHCIPIDPFYLTWKAREFGINTRFIELAGEINSSMPEYVVKKIQLSLNKIGRSVNEARVLILGIAYKADVDDARESPAVEILSKLVGLGAIVSYSDPHIPIFPRMRHYNYDLQSVELTKENLSKYDCVVITTNHKLFDYNMILESAKIIVDTRGVYRKFSEKITRA